MILFTFVLLVLLFPGLYGAAGAEVRLATGVGRPRLVVPDHGFVRHNQIDDFYPDTPRDMVLIGITSFNSCCSRDFTTDGKEIGWWFYPNGTEVPKIQNEAVVWNFFTSRYRKDVFLYRRRGGENGIHRLDIPVSAARNETLYVGLYRRADLGIPRVTSIQLNLASEYTVGETPKFNITCNSVGGPATTVTWTRDGEAVSGGNFTATRRLDDPVTAAYTLTLSVTGRQGGVYRCQVAKSGPGMSGDPVNSSMELEVKVASPPTDFNAEQVNKTSVRISWTPPAPKESVTGYQIYYMATDSQGTRGEFMTAPETNYRLIHDLQTGINYSFTMVALSEHLPSEVVGPVSLIMKAVPAVPMVTTMEVTATSVWLQWFQQSGMSIFNQPDSLEIAFQYTMGSLHNGFCIDYQHSDIVTLANGSTQQYNITGLQEHSTYNITIVAVNAAGKSAPSEVVITTLQTAPSGTPQEITILDTTSTEITLQWREVPCIERNGVIIGYTVRYSISGCNITLRNYSDTAATLVELIPLTNYSIEVAAFNVNGTGPFSTPIYMRTDDDSSCFAVTDGVTIKVECSGLETIPGIDGFLCSLDGGSSFMCTPPFSVSALSEGPHTIEVVGRRTDANGTVPIGQSQFIIDALDLYFINDTPQVDGTGILHAQFRTSRPDSNVSLTCRLIRRNGREVDDIQFDSTQDCGSGSVTYNNLPLGDYVFRVIARDTATGDAAVIRSGLRILGNNDFCTITAINRRVTVFGNSATVEFGNTGAPTGFLCRLDRQPYSPCSSPVTVTNVSPGGHRLTIRPAGCGRAGMGHRRISIYFEI